MQYQTEYRISELQLCKKFDKHAHDFGILGHCNAQSLAEFKSAIEALLQDSNVKVIVGTFRRHRPVIYYFEPNTRLTIMLSDTGDFVSGWKLSLMQEKWLLETGNLGGG